MCRMKLKRNLPENSNLIVLVWAYSCEIKTSYGSLENAAILPRLTIYTEEYNFTDGVTDWNWR